MTENVRGWAKAWKQATKRWRRRALKLAPEAELLAEWKELLAQQRRISAERGDYCGILVANDELALKFQALNRRVWEIKRQIFGDYYLFRNV